MIEIDKPNPFQILELPVHATNQEVVECGQELMDLAETEEKRRLFRWAMEQLITKPLTRLEYELYECPGSEYSDNDWEHFVKMNKRNPIDIHELAKQISPPDITDFDLAALIEFWVDGMLQVEKPDIRIAIQNTPFKPEIGPPPLEIKDVIFG